MPFFETQEGVLPVAENARERKLKLEEGQLLLLHELVFDACILKP